MEVCHPTPSLTHCRSRDNPSAGDTSLDANRQLLLHDVSRMHPRSRLYGNKMITDVGMGREFDEDKGWTVCHLDVIRSIRIVKEWKA